MLNSNAGDPKTLKAALGGEEADKWLDGLYSEYDNFMKREAWKRVKRPKGKRIMRTKNVFKKKLHAITKQTRYKVRNVVLGYEQIPGVDYSESYAAVVADQTVRTMLAVSLYQYGYWKELGEVWEIALSLDVEAAFLNSVLEEEVFIEIPELFADYCKARGIDQPNDNEVLLLMMGQYGLVQVARSWVRSFTRIMTHSSIGMTQCKTDPCLFVKHDEKGRLVLIAIIYIDDAIYCGLKGEARRFKEQVKKFVTITDIGKLDTHLGVDYQLMEDEHGIYFDCSMKKYVEDCVKEFEQHIQRICRDFKCPGKPSTSLLKNDGEPIEQSAYRKFVGRILFVVKKVLPDCVNAVRELSMHLENPGADAWKAMGRIVGYLKFHYQPLKLRCPLGLTIGGFVDSDWGADRNDRKSTTSYLTVIGDRALVNWLSRKQQTVSVSSTEAELYAESAATQDVLFERNMMEEMIGKKPEKPSIIRGDNMGAIFLASNLAVNQRTKHVDIRTRFITDHVEKNKDVKFIFIRSEDNCADAGSKNTAQQTHVKHAATIYDGMFPLPMKEDVGSGQ